MGWEDIRGWYDWPDIYDLAVAEARPGDMLVEVGVAYGRSLAYLGRKMIDSGKDNTILGIDPWLPTWAAVEDMYLPEAQGKDGYSEFLRSMATHAPAEFARVCHYKGVSRDITSGITSPIVSMVYIDGCHSYEWVKDDIEAWLPCMRQGAIMAGHDFGLPGVWAAVHEAFPHVEHDRGSSWFVRL